MWENSSRADVLGMTIPRLQFWFRILIAQFCRRPKSTVPGDHKVTVALSEGQKRTKKERGSFSLHWESSQNGQLTLHKTAGVFRVVQKSAPAWRLI